MGIRSGVLEKCLRGIVWMWGLVLVGSGLAKADNLYPAASVVCAVLGAEWVVAVWVVWGVTLLTAALGAGLLVGLRSRTWLACCCAAAVGLGSVSAIVALRGGGMGCGCMGSAHVPVYITLVCSIAGMVACGALVARGEGGGALRWGALRMGCVVACVLLVCGRMGLPGERVVADIVARALRGHTGVCVLVVVDDSCSVCRSALEKCAELHGMGVRVIRVYREGAGDETPVTEGGRVVVPSEDWWSMLEGNPPGFVVCRGGAVMSRARRAEDIVEAVRLVLGRK